MLEATYRIYSIRRHPLINAALQEAPSYQQGRRR